jgi:type VI secretion system secreted protein Hcp
MAVEMFLKLKDDVPGEVKASGHEGEIGILSFSFGANNPSSVASGSTGRGAGKVDLQNLSIHKEVDLASPVLFQHCCSGTHFDEATLIVREAGGKDPVEYWTMKMKQVFVDTISWGASSGGGKPGETVNLSFTECKITYWSQSEKGAKDKKAEAGWNVQTNAAAA